MMKSPDIFLSECPLCERPFAANPKREYIGISFIGNKKFKQLIVNAIYDLLNSEDLADAVAKPGCGFSFHSSMEPSDDEMKP